MSLQLHHSRSEMTFQFDPDRRQQSKQYVVPTRMIELSYQTVQVITHLVRWIWDLVLSGNEMIPPTTGMWVPMKGEPRQKVLKPTWYEWQILLSWATLSLFLKWQIPILTMENKSGPPIAFPLWHSRLLNRIYLYCLLMSSYAWLCSYHVSILLCRSDLCTF